MRISISVIIVAFKSRSFIACCLNSLQQASKSYDTEIIVIDNASGDGLGGFILQEYSDIRFFQNKENIGFGSACNQGAQIANGDYLVFLNGRQSFFLMFCGWNCPIDFLCRFFVGANF